MKKQPSMAGVPAQAADRQPISKSLRFEVFKRDGFRCRYCGNTPDVAVLHVDHIIAVSGGGTNDPINLATSCAPCNLGKGPRSLLESTISVQADPESIRERKEQVGAFLALQREMRDANEGLVDLLMDEWKTCVSSKVHHDVEKRLRNLVGCVPITLIAEGISILGRSRLADPKRTGTVDQLKYFNGVLKKLRAAADSRGGRGGFCTPTPSEYPAKGTLPVLPSEADGVPTEGEVLKSQGGAEGVGGRGNTSRGQA